VVCHQPLHTPQHIKLTQVPSSWLR
jgi:hypothetical protein